MITKIISKYIKINKLTYIFILLSIFTASFRILFYMFFLIIIHELGHFITAKIFGIELDKIYIYPLGGVAKFYMPYNFSAVKELIILINGPLFQEIAKIILIYLFPQHTNLITTYHYSILLFNLLPIYPLDGGRIVNIIFSSFKPFKKSLKITISISYIIIFILFLININNIKINILVLVSFLVYKVYKEDKSINLKYENFLLERYLNKHKFKNSKIINNSNNFYKNKRHLIKENDKYILENEFLLKKYQKT